jgi:hypothetical protein
MSLYNLIICPYYIHHKNICQAFFSIFFNYFLPFVTIYLIILKLFSPFSGFLRIFSDFLTFFKPFSKKLFLFFSSFFKLSLIIQQLCKVETAKKCTKKQRQRPYGKNIP